MSASTARRSGDASPAKKAKGGGGGCVTKRYVSAHLKFARPAPSCSLLWPSRGCLSHTLSPTVSPSQSFPQPAVRADAAHGTLAPSWCSARGIGRGGEARLPERCCCPHVTTCAHPLCFSWCSFAIIDRPLFAGLRTSANDHQTTPKPSERRSLTPTRSTWPEPSAASAHSGLARLPRPLSSPPPHPQDTHALALIE